MHGEQSIIIYKMYNMPNKILHFEEFKSICNNYAPNYDKYFTDPNNFTLTVSASRYDFINKVFTYLAEITSNEVNLVNNFFDLFYENKITMFYANAYFNSSEITNESLFLFIQTANKYFSDVVNNTVRQMLIYEFTFYGKTINISQFNEKYELFQKYRFNIRNIYFRPIINYSYSANSDNSFSSMIEFSEDYINKLQNISTKSTNNTELSKILTYITNPLSFALSPINSKHNDYYSQLYSLNKFNFSSISLLDFAKNNITNNNKGPILISLAEDLVRTYNQNINNSVIDSEEFNFTGNTSNPNTDEYQIDFSRVVNKNKFNFELKYFAESYRVSSFSDINILDIRSILYKILLRQYCYNPELDLSNNQSYVVGDHIPSDVKSSVENQINSDINTVNLYLSDLSYANEQISKIVEKFAADKNHYERMYDL